VSKTAPEYRKSERDTQYQTLLGDYEKLRARIAALKAIDHVLRGKPRDLLEEVASTLIRAAEASDPRVGHYNEPDRITRSIDSYPMPGASTRNARRAARRFHDDLDKAIQTYDDKQSRNFGTDQVNPPPPKTRCGNRECGLYDKRVPVWDRRGTALEYCASCGRRLPAPKEAA
jgi:hypothetical protein